MQTLACTNAPAQPARAPRIGLTGGIGCGKSTVCRYLSEKGIRCLETDLIARRMLETDHDIHTALRDRWGSRVFTVDGKVDRAAIASIVFNQADELTWLESQLHPHVRQEWVTALETHTEHPIVVEIPLLFEKQLSTFFDYTVCIAAAPSIQQARLIECGMTPEQFQKRRQQQLPLDQKMQLSDFILTNDGTLDALYLQIERLCHCLQLR